MRERIQGREVRGKEIDGERRRAKIFVVREERMEARLKERRRERKNEKVTEEDGERERT